MAEPKNTATLASNLMSGQFINVQKLHIAKMLTDEPNGTATYETPINLGRILRKVDIKPKTSQAELYADGQSMFQSDKRNGKKRYTKFYKVQFTEPSETGSTKEENIAYATPTITAKAIYRLSDGLSYTKADEESGFTEAADWYASV